VSGPEALTVEEDRLRRRLALYERCHGPDPDCYRAIAEWWAICSEESADPATSLRHADNHNRLATNIEVRPRHYKLKPFGKTDWEWSGLSPST